MRIRSVKHTAVAIIVGLAVSSIGVIGTASAGTSWSCFHQKEAERRFTKKMNYARAKKGVGKMRLDKQLSRVARIHSKQMAKQHALYHSSPYKLSERVTREKLLSENVGRGGSVSGIHAAFMDSPGHRDNILRSNWRHVGVGTVTRDKVMYVTVVFESRQDPGTTIKPPSC